MPGAFLQIEDLQTHFPVDAGLIFKHPLGTVRAVDGVRLSIEEGEVLGIVGESGCGKSTLGRTIVQLIPPTAGTVILEGRNLNQLHGRGLRRARRDFQMIFQDPYASLNPRLNVFDTLAEAILARALAVEPKLIIADEPVSALDVSIQAQIINLLVLLRREMKLTLIFISHDLSVVKHISDRIAVMYLGKVVELGEARAVLEKPLHPYTKALISAVPIVDPTREHARKRIVLPGDPPSPMNPPVGCRFHPRCPYMIDACKAEVPPLADWGGNHFAACIRVPEINVL